MENGSEHRGDTMFRAVFYRRELWYDIDKSKKYMLKIINIYLYVTLEVFFDSNRYHWMLTDTYREEKL